MFFMGPANGKKLVHRFAMLSVRPKVKYKSLSLAQVISKQLGRDSRVLSLLKISLRALKPESPSQSLTVWPYLML